MICKSLYDYFETLLTATIVTKVAFVSGRPQIKVTRGLKEMLNYYQ